jgi:hypothetical protein
MSFTKDK